MKLWEIRRRREYIDKREAREYLHQVRIANAGFNGGESANSFQKELQRRAFPPILTLEDKLERQKKYKDKPRNWIREMLEQARNQQD